jgi:hypothetical protein
MSADPFVVTAEARSRLAPAVVCAWIEAKPVEHRTAGPGEARVEVLERTETVCVHRITDKNFSQTTRRVRVAPNRWHSELSCEDAKVGRFQIRQELTVLPVADGPGSVLAQVSQAAPLDPRGRRAAWVAKVFLRQLERSVSHGLAALVLEMEAESGLPVDPSSVFGHIPAGPRSWSRLTGVTSHYAPQHDWAAVGVLVAGLLGSALGMGVLLTEGLRAEPDDPSLTAALIAGALLLIAAVLVLLVSWLERRHSVRRVESGPRGITLHLRRGGAIELPWADLGLGAVRTKGPWFGVHFRHPKFGAESKLWLTPADARLVLASPYCPPVKPAAYVLQLLGLGPTVPEAATLGQ